MSSASMWLDTAHRIGTRIVKDAIWTADACTWDVRVPVARLGQFESRSARAGVTLYQGTAGIALFLLELYRQTQDAAIGRAAKGALATTLREGGSQLPGSFGFHSGRVGIAWALVRAAAVTGEGAWLDAARSVLSPLPAHVTAHVQHTDVIGGAAGAIPALLDMARVLPPALTTDVAIGLGRQIMSQARRGRQGWSWRGLPSSVQDLTGYAHGASGYGHALLELYAVTGDDEYRYGAVQSMLYERAGYDASLRNWLDYRYSALSEHLTYGSLTQLRERMRSNDPLPPYEKHAMHAWCHGAPGIGLARLRAVEILGPQHRDEALDAVRATLDAMNGPAPGYSLCHGHMGNAETLLVAAAILSMPECRRAVEDRAAEARARYELGGLPWPCGTIKGVRDPSLLLGESGIGYFYLRLADAETPSVLLVTPATQLSVDAPRMPAGSQRRAHIHDHFSETLASLAQLCPDRAGDFEAAIAVAERPVIAAFSWLTETIAADSDESRREALADAFAVERARYLLDEHTDDFTREVLYDIVRPEPETLNWESIALQTADHVRIVRRAGVGVTGTPSLVYWKDCAARSRPLSEFVALLLEEARDAATVHELAARVADRCEGATAEQLEHTVLAQLQAAYSVGLVQAVAARRHAGVTS